MNTITLPFHEYENLRSRMTDLQGEVAKLRAAVAERDSALAFAQGYIQQLLEERVEAKRHAGSTQPAKPDAPVEQAEGAQKPEAELTHCRACGAPRPT